ncbi:MAG: DNA repair protein RadA [Magnetococcus sp. WYHC-3]
MARDRILFFCGECGHEHGRWQGQCAGCGVWNTLREAPSAGRARGGRVAATPVAAGGIQPLGALAGLREQRLMIGIGELDRVLGGGLVTGSAVLIGGDPGIGKSTLLLSALAQMAGQRRVLYISGEESAAQIRLRAERLGVADSGLLVGMETSLEAILTAVAEQNPDVLVIDSIQTVAGEGVAAAAGSVTQVRECAARLIGAAKSRAMALFLVGHVTKDGQIAGPRILEHMVDTVLYFEGERGHNYRLLRAVKNRFGATNEIGVFEMGEAGLREVANPSALFLGDREGRGSSAVVFPGMEGTRPMLLEIQSLVAPSPLAQPRRTTLGLDQNRLAMLVAVLEKRIGMGLYTHDIFLNVTGGARIVEPAADLAVVVSLWASHRNRSVDPALVILGEVGLGGEIRPVSRAGERLREAAKLGFTRCLLPAKSLAGIPGVPPLQPEPVAHLEEALSRFEA